MQINGSSATKTGNASVDAPVRVQVGIDAAVVANHHVCVRSIGADGKDRTERFLAAPTLAGLALLTRRLAPYPGAVAVAEPTSMTWLSLSVAVSEAGGQLALLGSRHSARLRGAIVGKNKSDVIDADVLARAGDVFTLRALRPPEPTQLALRRACTRRGRGGDRRQPVLAPADVAGAVGLPGRVERLRWFAADRPWPSWVDGPTSPISAPRAEQA